jgi:hypothetical protein
VRYSRSAGVFFGTLVAAVTLSALPSSRYLPVDLVRPAKAVAIAAPQGWAFFTKDPTETADLAYVRRDRHWVVAIDTLTAVDRTGVSRTARAMDAEVSALMAGHGDVFGSCPANADINRCAEDAPRTRRNFVDLKPPLCGPVLVRRITPVPFAYGTRVAAMPSKVVIVDVACGA